MENGLCHIRSAGRFFNSNHFARIKKITALLTGRISELVGVTREALK